MENLTLTSRNVAAISRACKTARKIQTDFPQVADMYRRGLYIREIIKVLDIQGNYGITPRIAESATQMAIAGHEGKFGSENLEGLIEDEKELEELRLRHRYNSSSDNYRRGIGLGSLTAGQKTAVGKKGSKRAAELGKGIAALTTEQLSNNGRKGIVKSMETRGITPWSEDEKDMRWNYLGRQNIFIKQAVAILENRKLLK